jgi:hypothetical protein
MPRLTARDMVGLRWSWIGPKLERDEHGNEWYELRIAELPEFFVAAPTAEAARVEAAPVSAPPRARLKGGSGG